MEDLEAKIRAEELRSDGRITIRTADTNIWMSRPDTFYILTGNFEEIKDSETELEGLSINGDPINPKNKEPHDLVIITHTIDELDRLTHSDVPEKRHRANEALREIEKLFTIYGSPERDIDYTSGKNHITLPNGARIYCHSGPIGFKGLAFRLLNRLHVWTTDKLIQASFKDFLSTHPEYKRAIQISQDVGYRVNALLTGNKADNSRFDKVKNPRQINPGLSYCTIAQDTLAHVRKNSIIRPEDLGFTRETLRTNHIMMGSTLDGSSVLMTYKREKGGFMGLQYYDAFALWLEDAKKTRRRMTHHEVKPYSVSEESIRRFVMSLQEDKSINPVVAAGYFEQLDDLKEKLKSEKMKPKHYSRNLKSMYERLASDESRTQSRLRMPAVKNKFNVRGTQPAFIDMMIDPEIDIIGLNATAGYGKTVWALLTGLYHVSMGNYDKIHYFSAQASAEKPLAALPGNKSAKIAEDVNQVSDAFGSLFGGTYGTQFLKDLQEKGILELDVISGIIGRNLDGKFLIFDETHFYDRERLGYIVQRIADSKAVFLSGGEQRHVAVDRYVSDDNSGILHYFEKSVDQPNCAAFFAPKTESYRNPKLVVLAQRMLSKMWGFRT